MSVLQPVRVEERFTHAISVSCSLSVLTMPLVRVGPNFDTRLPNDKG